MNDIEELKNSMFSQLSEYWIDNYARRELTSQTVASYRSMLVTINKSIGNDIITMIEPKNILDFCLQLKDSASRNSGARPKRNFKELLALKNMTRAKLADLTQMAPMTVTALTQGKNITIENARKISEAMSISFNELFDLETSKKVSKKTVLNYLRLISSIMQTAVEWDVLEFNPAKSVPISRIPDD